jgi:hypothetical protein
MRRLLSWCALPLALLAASGCDEFLTVPNPTVIDASALNPVQDAPTLANSARQNFAVALGSALQAGGLLTGEVAATETDPSFNQFSYRDVATTNGSNGGLWRGLHLALSSSRFVLSLALPNPTQNLVRAQAAVIAGFSYEYLGESYCEATVPLGPQTPGPRVTQATVLDSAIASFTLAINVAQAAGTAGDTLRNLALVGRARANLQRGNRAAALADANAVAAGFSYSLPFLDDLANRGRLGNPIWSALFGRGSFQVDTVWRLANDPRVPWALGPAVRLSAVDGTTPYYVPLKYPSFSAPIRLASKLEADYIAIEASSTPTQDIASVAAFINARRTAASAPAGAYVAPATFAQALRDLMTEKGFDFWLEGKRQGDLLRLGAAAIRGLPPTGAVFYKTPFPFVGSTTCLPVPFGETSTNPNF